MIKTTAEIVFEETKCIHNCSMSDGLKRKNRKWIPVEEVREIIENYTNNELDCLSTAFDSFDEEEFEEVKKEFKEALLKELNLEVK